MFVYLGMAVFTFPIFQSTVYTLVLWATLACFVGRLHIYVGSWLTNCFRGPDSYPKPISGVYMFIMWFSGLRGGVAFALASVSFADLDFPQKCGGLTEAQKVGLAMCGEGSEMNDSLAILQTTLMIATFTIFVFGGAITEVCQAGGVLQPKGVPEHAPKEDTTKGMGAFNKLTLIPWLTLPGAIKDAEEEETGVRFDAAIEHPYAPAADEPLWGLAYEPAPAGPGPSTKDIKTKLAGEGSEIEMVSLDDKVDELRMSFPGKASYVPRRCRPELRGGSHRGACRTTHMLPHYTHVAALHAWCRTCMHVAALARMVPHLHAWCRTCTRVAASRAKQR